MRWAKLRGTDSLRYLDLSKLWYLRQVDARYWKQGFFQSGYQTNIWPGTLMSGPQCHGIEYRTQIYHLNTRLVQYSDDYRTIEKGPCTATLLPGLYVRLSSWQVTLLSSSYSSYSRMSRGWWSRTCAMKLSQCLFKQQQFNISSNCIPWGSEIRTCPVFEWLKKVG